MFFYKKKQIAGIYIGIHLLYLTQGFNPSLDTFYSILLLLVLGIDLFYFFKVNSIFGGSSFIRALNLFILLITVYGLIHILMPLDPTLLQIENYRPHTYLTNAYRHMLQIYPLYFFVKKGYIDEEVIKAWIIPSVVAVLVAFYVESQRILIESLTGELTEANNIGYLVVSLFPLAYFIKNKYFRYLLVSITIIFVFVSTKRGAILVAGLLLIPFLYYELKTASRREKITILVLINVSGLLLFKYLYDMYEESDYMQYIVEKTSQGNSSGRDELYSVAWNQFINGSPFTLLFGHGADSTYYLVGNRAHDDWLELLVNQGLLGFVIYANFWLVVIRIWLKSKFHRFYYVLMASFLLFFIPKTILSMLYNDLSPVACLPFVWCIVNVETSLKRKKVNKYE